MKRSRNLPRRQSTSKGLRPALVAAQREAETAETAAKSARAQFKRFRKVYREAKKLAKAARKKVKGLRKWLKATAASRRRRPQKGSKVPAAPKAKARRARPAKTKRESSVRERWKGARATVAENQVAAHEREARAAQTDSAAPLHSGAPFPEPPVRVEPPPPTTSDPASG